MQLLLNAINAETITRLAQICYEMNRHIAVNQKDYSNNSWAKTSQNDRVEWTKWVQEQLDGNFVIQEDAPERDQLIRACLLSVLSTWSGAPQMGPQIPPLPYEPPVVEPDAEPEPEPEPEPEVVDDVEVLDDEEELSPQQKAAQTRAANKAKEKENG